MRRLHFLYKMALFMSQDVTDHHFQIKCIPMESSTQHCVLLSCDVDPIAALTKVEDGFGNKGFSGVITEEHSVLRVKADGLVEVGGCAHPQPLSPMYKYQTDMTMPKESLNAFYWGIKNELSAMEAPVKKALFIMNKLFENYAYVSGITTVKTTAEEAFAGGMGVCQDYAHILIGLLRMAGIPSRYVAGLLLGEGATHAWVEIWNEGIWIGLDPTHNRLVDDTYIKLTHGRDFNDGAVDKGHFTGCAFQEQKIYVKVEEVVD